MKKKSYNPFVMWGAWLGALIGSVPLVVIFIVAVKSGAHDYGMAILPLIFFTIVGFISGFLVGWGIHSLFRWLR